eukprot:ANDGO_03305.mRNA.1 putative hemerythrin-like protein C869.06c
MNNNDLRDGCQLLTEDHNKVRGLFREYWAKKGFQEKHAVSMQICRELAMHAAVEEMHLYPLVRSKLGDDHGAEMADDSLKDHMAVKMACDSIERVTQDEGLLDDWMNDLWNDFEKHSKEEEMEIFTRLRMVCTQGELMSLKSKLESSKKLAPTKAHPYMPDKPPMNLVTGPIAGIADRAVDAAKGMFSSREQ